MRTFKQLFFVLAILAFANTLHGQTVHELIKSGREKVDKKDYTGAIADCHKSHLSNPI
jgi:hypothetical protein